MQNSKVSSSEIFKNSFLQSFKKLHPATQAKNPVMFVVFVGAILCSFIFLFHTNQNEPSWFVANIALWLWFTVLFANFSEAIAEGRGKAQAESLKKAGKNILAKKLSSKDNRKNFKIVDAGELRIGDIILVEAGDFIALDGKVISGIAAVDESAITGESAPVIRESGGDRDSATGGTKVISDWIVIQITTNPGESHLDKMIALVEGAKRQKTPNEIALGVLLAAMTIIFLLVCATLLPFSIFAVERAGSGSAISVTVLIALLVCLAPTTIGALLSAIGIAGMNRLIKSNVIAYSGRAVEAAGDINVLLLDKTGTITHGNRQAVDFIPAFGVTINELAEAAELSSIADETPEGRHIVELAHSKYGVKEKNLENLNASFIPFSAETRVSGVILDGVEIVKGAGDAIESRLKKNSIEIPSEVKKEVETIARQGGTPLLVAKDKKVLGVIHLKDVVKLGIKQRLARLRAMGIKSVMITGDNPLTAAAIASEAGVDDFIAEATPEAKLKYIRKMQEGGELVAMVGDGTNDAPALAQSDVVVVMNSGTGAAKEAGNMIDLDSNPTKLIEIVEIGKQLLMTRGALTTFSISNDLAKYFAIIPAAFATVYPTLGVLNIMGLASPRSAILSAVIFNAAIIPFLIPLALRGVKYHPASASVLLRRNIFIYGVGGLITPFIGIKLIDECLKFII